MALTKAETKRMEDLERGIREARSLRWPDYPEPAFMTVTEIKESLAPGGYKFGGREPEMVARGWFVNTYDRGRVTLGCSNGTFHSNSGDYTTTQNMGWMFRDEIDAWRYLRLKKTQEYAAHLAEIDARIATLKTA